MSTDTLPPPAPETLLYVRLYTSPVIHVIDTTAPVLPDHDSERPRSLCGVKPYWPGVWIDAEGDVCRTCDTVLEALVRDRQP